MEYQKGEVANELEILDKIDRLVQPYYAHLFRGDPYPPVGYDHSQPRVSYLGIDEFMQEAEQYAQLRIGYISKPFSSNDNVHIHPHDSKTR